MTERLVSVAIKRLGIVHTDVGGAPARAHWRLREALGDAEPMKPTAGDQDGFYTSNGRFLSRAEAVDVACACGQLAEPFGRPLLSSDLDW